MNRTENDTLNEVARSRKVSCVYSLLDVDSRLIFLFICLSYCVRSIENSRNFEKDFVWGEVVS